MKKLCLIDGSNMMFRAYFATAYTGNLMQNSHGQYTNAVYGMANILNALLKEDYTHVCVAFDKGKETYRHQAYADYKAGRAKMPEEFVSQLPLIEALVQKMGFFVFEDAALEADDIIASIAKQYTDSVDQIDIVSNDKDLYQLLGGNIRLRIQKKNEPANLYFDQAALLDTVGLKPSQIPDLKGLMGDASDNLPGIPGIGEKTAVKLLQEYETLEALLEHVNELKGKLKERVVEHGQMALHWRHLATLIQDAALPFDLDDLAFHGPTEALLSFYQELEMHSLAKRLGTVAVAPKETLETTDRHTVYQPYAAVVPIHLPGLPHRQTLHGFAVAFGDKQSYLSYDEALKDSAFKAFLEDPSVPKITYDLKAFEVLCEHTPFTVQGVIFDTLLAAYVLNPSSTTKEFKVMANHFDCGLTLPYEEEIFNKGAKLALPSDTVLKPYALALVQTVLELHTVCEAQLKANDQWALFHDFEMPLASLLARMELTGITLDQEALDRFDVTITEEVDGLEAMIYGLAGETFNIDSPKQLGDVLFETLKLPAQGKGKTGYTTSVDVLKKLESHHPIVGAIMRYRTLKKLQTTYVNGLRQAVFEDGKIHTTYKQALTQTGRLSSVEPNLQNIPIRTDVGRSLRKVFTAEPGRLLLASDYSQIELRLLAHLADEQTMIQAFQNNEDIHRITGQNVFGKTSISDDDRRIAKAVNFGIIYGQSAWSLADDLGIPLKQAEAFIETYFERFSGIKAYMDGVVEGAVTHGFVTTLLNRRRYIPELHSKIYAQREFGKRTAMNAPLQGSAADIIKAAMIALDKALKDAQCDAYLVLQIHDELVLSVHPDHLEKAQEIVRNSMENVISLKVPLTVSMNHGVNLYDAK